MTMHEMMTRGAVGARRSGAYLSVLVLAWVLGCNQADPPGYTDSDTETSGDGDGDSGDGDGDGDGDSGDGDGDGDQTTDTDATAGDMADTTGENPFADTLYPLADGAVWVYLDKNTNGQVLGMEIVESTEIQWEGQRAFEVVDSPGNSGEFTESILVQNGDLTLRVHKEVQTADAIVEIVDYDPGFPRANDGWMMVGQTEELFYTRTATDGMGLNPSVEERAHIFTVLAVDEEVTVPAGTFSCMKVERVRSLGASAGERVVFWFAYGIGKVREERPAESLIEELASVSIPGAVDLP